MNIVLLVVTLAALVAAAFGLVFLWDSIKPIAKHPDIAKIQWPVRSFETKDVNRSKKA